VVSWPGMGWPAAEVTEQEDPMVGWKGNTHSQLVGYTCEHISICILCVMSKRNELCM
jgi:hypothetical protein